MDLATSALNVNSEERPNVDAAIGANSFRSCPTVVVTNWEGKGVSTPLLGELHASAVKLGSI